MHIRRIRKQIYAIFVYQIHVYLANVFLRENIEINFTIIVDFSQMWTLTPRLFISFFAIHSSIHTLFRYKKIIWRLKSIYEKLQIKLELIEKLSKFQGQTLMLQNMCIYIFSINVHQILAMFINQQATNTRFYCLVCLSKG